MRDPVQQHQTTEGTKESTQERRCLRDEEQSICKSTREHSHSPCTKKVPETFLFCGQPAGVNSLRKGATFQMDRQVRACTTLLGDTDMLGRFSGGDMVALDAQYHPQCLMIGLYNRTRKVQSTGLRPRASNVGSCLH